MTHNVELRDRLLRQKDGYSLEQAFYTSESILEADLESFFYQDWLFMIPACEISKSGDYVTQKVGQYDIVIVRGDDGIIRALHNSCRHRGSRLCSAQKGSAPKLVCPYHQWTYELDGKLLYARDMGDDFKPEQHSLKAVHCREIAGLVFICLANIAPDFSELEGHLANYLGPHKLGNAKVAHSSTIVENGNWKLVFENNRECYHCSGSHPALCRTFPDAPAFTAVTSAGFPQDVKDHWKKCEAIDLPSKYVIDPGSYWRLARVPLIGEAESFTMSGKTAVSRLMGDISVKAAGSLLLFSYPNSWNHFLSDHAIVFQVMPINAVQTQVTTKWLVHKDAVEGRDYDLETLTHVWKNTNDEDRRVVEENQIGVNSPAYEPGPYSPIHESGVLQFVEWYKATLLSRLEGSSLMQAAE